MFHRRSSDMGEGRRTLYKLGGSGYEMPSLQLNELKTLVSRDIV